MVPRPARTQRQQGVSPTAAGSARSRAASAAASVAIGIMNVLLPGFVKRDFAHRIALMTGLYTMALCAGAAAGAGFTVPGLALTGGLIAGGAANVAVRASAGGVHAIEIARSV